MQRVGLVLLVVALAIASMVFGPAAVAQPEPITDVTPRSGLLDGQSVSVTGTDWPASTNITVSECGFVPTFDETCLAEQHIMTDAEGSFSTSYVVHRFVDHGDCVTSIDVGCILRVALADSSFGETYTLQFNVASSQGPDLIIRRRSDGTLFFDNFYTTRAVTYSHPIVDGNWTFAVVVQNDGTATADITVHANSVAAPFAVRYFYGYYDVTTDVTGSGLVLPAMAPGESRSFAVRFAADPATPSNRFTNITMTATTPRVIGPQDALKLGVSSG